MTFVEAAKQVLRENGNDPMTANEIWTKVSEKGLYESKGKTPDVSMNAILGRNSSNSKYSSITSDTFRIVDGKPVRYQLNRYIPKMVRESLLENGFVDSEALEKRILELEKRNSELEDKLSKICEKMNIK